jgi:hypothetical protein
MIGLLLVVVSAVYLAFLAAVEAWVVVRREPTISRRIQGWVRDNHQLAIGLATVAGWLIAHFSGWPG